MGLVTIQVVELLLCVVVWVVGRLLGVRGVDVHGGLYKPGDPQLRWGHRVTAAAVKRRRPPPVAPHRGLRLLPTTYCSRLSVAKS